MSEENLLNICRQKYTYHRDGYLTRNHAAQGCKAGQRVGTIGPDRRERTMVGGRGGKMYLTYRLIFLMEHGYMPKYVDHINGDPADNRIENLREATAMQNGTNRGKQTNNTSGYKNVYPFRNGYVAFFTHEGNQIRAKGTFADPYEAHKEIEKLRKLHQGHWRHQNG